MNKWIESFLLHPFFNRFNLSYIFLWFGVGIWPGEPDFFLAGLFSEVLYLVIRGVVDRGANPYLQIRKLSFQARRRFLTVAERASKIKDAFESADAESKILNYSLNQAKRLSKVFLELLIMEKRFEDYLKRTTKENFELKSTKLRQAVEGSTGQRKSLALRNLEIFEKRRSKHEKMKNDLGIIRLQLDTIQNTLDLLFDTALGLGMPDDSSPQVDLLLTNMEDAETFIEDLRDTVPIYQSTKVK